MEKDKTKLTNLLRIGIFLFGISIFLWNCEKDHVHFHEQNSVAKKFNYNVNKISYEELIEDRDFKKPLEIIQRKFIGNQHQQSTLSRSTTQLNDDLVILTDEVNRVETDNGDITWTFETEAPVFDNVDFENFVVKKQNDEFYYYLITYKYSSDNPEGEFESTKSYSVREEYLTLDNLDLSARNNEVYNYGGSSDAFDWVWPDDGGGGESDCAEIYTEIEPCSSGGYHTLTYACQHSNGIHGVSNSPPCDDVCSGTTVVTVIDYSGCDNGTYDPPSGPTGDPNDGQIDGGNGVPTGGGGSNPVNNTPVNPTVTAPLNSDGTNAIPTFLGNTLNLTDSQISWIDNQTVEHQTLILNYVSSSDEDISNIEKTIKMYIEVSENSNILGPYDSNFFNAINPYIDADLTDPYLQAVFMAHFSVQCAMLKLQNPDWSDAKVYWEASKEMIHIALDLGGMVPVIGEVCDLVNGVIYVIEGDGVNATLSFAAMIPVAGWFATGAKYANKAITLANGSKITLKWIVKADGIIDFGRRNILRAILAITDAAKHAHHLIPWAIRNHDVVQKAAKSGSAFHMNEALNGIAVASWRNQPNHNNYNNLIKDKLDDYFEDFPNATPDQCYSFISNLINNIRDWVVNNPNSHLNDLVL